MINEVNKGAMRAYHEECEKARSEAVEEYFERLKTELKDISGLNAADRITVLGCMKVARSEMFGEGSSRFLEKAHDEAVKDFFHFLVDKAKDGSVAVSDLPDLVSEWRDDSSTASGSPSFSGTVKGMSWLEKRLLKLSRRE